MQVFNGLLSIANTDGIGVADVQCAYLVSDGA